MPITRSFLQSLDQTSAYYVFCHAAWRRSRGKKEATVPYGGILNPELALDLAATIVQKISRVEEMNDQGLALLERGKDYYSANENELCLMIHYIIESADDPETAKKCLLGMLDIPPGAALELSAATSQEYLSQFREQLVKERKSDGPLERKIVRAINSGATPTMLEEIYRSRGGLVTKDGMFIVVTICDTRGITYEF